jgi:hypothetical protein
MRHIARFFCIFLTFCTLQTQAQTSALLSADSTQVETGNPFVLRITLSDTKIPDTLDFGPWQGIIGKKNVLSETGWVRKGNSLTREIALIFFDADTLNLPPLSIAFKAADSIQTNSLEIQVYASPAPEDLNDMAPIKDISREPVYWTDHLNMIFWVLGAITLLALLFWWYARANKRNMLSRTLELPPHELALKKLAVLSQKPLWSTGAIKAYCAELTFIIREYLEKRYQVPALECPSAELLAHLNQTDFPADLKSGLETVLAQTDLVKFAKAIPPDSFQAYSMDFAVELVNKTIPAPVEEPTEENPVQA